MAVNEMTPAGGSNKGVSLAEAIFGITDPDDRHGAVVQAYKKITGETLDAKTLLKRAAVGLEETERLVLQDSHWIYNHSPDEVDGLYLPSMLVNTFVHRAPWNGAYATLLRTWPFYESWYRQHVPPHVGESTGSTARRALLLGSTAFSILPFVELSKSVFAAEPHIIDPRVGSIQRRHQVREGNIFAPPADFVTSMDVVVSHRLTWGMLDAKGRVISEDNEAQLWDELAESIASVLRPGGHLFMVELPYGFDLDHITCKANQVAVRRLDRHMTSALGKARLTDIHIRDGADMAEVDFLFDPNRQFKKYESVPQPWVRAVHVRKP
jgi:SAM-dependent methyltransferase